MRKISAPPAKKSVWSNVLKIAFAGVVVFMLADMRSSIKGNESGTGLFKSAHAQKTQKIETIFCYSEDTQYAITHDFDKPDILFCRSHDPAMDIKRFNLKQLYQMGWRIAHFSTTVFPKYRSGDDRSANVYNNYVFEK